MVYMCFSCVWFDDKLDDEFGFVFDLVEDYFGEEYVLSGDWVGM